MADILHRARTLLRELFDALHFEDIDAFRNVMMPARWRDAQYDLPASTPLWYMNAPVYYDNRASTHSADSSVSEHDVQALYGRFAQMIENLYPHAKTDGGSQEPRGFVMFPIEITEIGFSARKDGPVKELFIASRGSAPYIALYQWLKMY